MPMYQETAIRADNEGLALYGTLCAPASGKTLACVLMIAGSGGHDRNQNSPRLALNLFNQLAHPLAAQGIASVRYDKRGCGKSSGDFQRAGYFDLVSDARAMLRQMRSSVAGDCPLFLLGHSEGAMIAPQLAADTPGLAGQVLLAPFVGSFAALIQQQALQIVREVNAMPGLRGLVSRLLLGLSGDVSKTQAEMLRRVRESEADVVRYRLSRLRAKWLRELDALDTTALFSAIRIPTLAVAAGKDLQCNPDDVEKIQALNPAWIEAVRLDNLSHLLRTENGTPSLQHIRQQAAEPLDPRVDALVAAWITARVQSSSGGAPPAKQLPLV